MLSNLLLEFSVKYIVLIGQRVELAGVTAHGTRFSEKGLHNISSNIPRRYQGSLFSPKVVFLNPDIDVRKGGT